MQLEGWEAGGPGAVRPGRTPRTVSFVLAGGDGTRLHPLTLHRPKPAVPFGGVFRLVDFVLANLVNSGERRIFVLTRRDAGPLLGYLRQAWIPRAGRLGALVWPLPAPGTSPGLSYRGTADAIGRNARILEDVGADVALVFGADHVYTMDVARFVEFHLASGAEITVAAVPMPLDRCGELGTMAVGAGGRVLGFEEKTPSPTPLRDDPSRAWVSMGNYAFRPEALFRELRDDARDADSRHDFGRDILPKACHRRRVFAYDFRRNEVPGFSGPCDYWRDVGTVRNYYDGNMDLLDAAIRLDVRNPLWPVEPGGVPPVEAAGPSGGAEIVGSSIRGAVVRPGARVVRSLLGPGVVVAEDAVVEDAIVMGRSQVGRGARVRNAIVDTGNAIGPGESVGGDPERDARRHHVEPDGLVVVPQDPADAERETAGAIAPEVPGGPPSLRRYLGLRFRRREVRGSGSVTASHPRPRPLRAAPAVPRSRWRS